MSAVPDEKRAEPGLRAVLHEALQAEAAAIAAFAETGIDTLTAAINLIQASQGPLIVTGIGKSGHVARKIASTFSSIGKPAIYLHAAEASHGDLGLVQPGSVVLALSNSGETTELSDLLHYCRAYDIAIIALTASATSTLARASKVAIAYGAVREVCPNGLAPTTSTTLSMAIGDALAIGVSVRLGTAPDDFRKYHPGGKLGLRLLKTADLMRTGDALPRVPADMPMSEAVVIMSEKALGIAVIVDADNRIEGIITDGDMRRNIQRLWASRTGEIATHNPVRIDRNWLISDAADLMSARGITVCLVEDENGCLEGALSIHDCLRAGAV